VGHIPLRSDLFVYSINAVQTATFSTSDNVQRENFSWGTFRCQRPNATLAASSGFDQPSMIALASSRTLELGAVLEGWPTNRPLLAHRRDKLRRFRMAVGLKITMLCAISGPCA
jgi:hypothetical protein